MIRRTEHWVKSLRHQLYYFYLLIFLIMCVFLYKRIVCFWDGNTTTTAKIWKFILGTRVCRKDKGTKLLSGEDFISFVLTTSKLLLKSCYNHSPGSVSRLNNRKYSARTKFVRLRFDQVVPHGFCGSQTFPRTPFIASVKVTNLKAFPGDHWNDTNHIVDHSHRLIVVSQKNQLAH